jgi:glycosyltransferase involved in cell wall biosynthesis
MRKKSIILFQPFLRKFVLDIGEGLRFFVFSSKSDSAHADTKTFYKTRASSFEEEVNRIKITGFQKLRRWVPLPNIRFRWEKKGDILFTYGCLLITNRPYCVYVENGAALHNYDPKILHHPLAKFLLLPFVISPQLRHIVFMSQMAERSFFATLDIKSEWMRKIFKRKCIQLYPKFRDPGPVTPKSFTRTLRLLFTGVYYMKGGRETLKAFQEIHKKNPNIVLTVLTPLHMLHPKDRLELETSAGVNLLDATLRREEMESLYRSHHIFLFPSFKDTFGLVLIEALSFGLPIIAIDQYAVTEMVRDGYNGWVFPDHPLTDYDRNTARMRGEFYDVREFYKKLFSLQSKNAMEPIEKFLEQSVLRYIDNPEILEEHSRNSRNLYDEKFHESILREKWENMFIKSFEKQSL